MPSWIDYDHGITAVDAHLVRPMLDAVHLVVEGDRAAIVDTGSNDAVPYVLAALAARGLAPEQVDWVMLTHVHLDHAGGAGLLMSKLPNARLTVHPRGARHMIDPSRLSAATVAVYGEEVARRMYGTIVPVPAERVLETPDGASVSLAGRRFEFLDTPGHARHHVCIVDERSGHVFAGDTFGLSYRELEHDGRQGIFPSTTPVQFDPPALHASIDRLLARAPGAIYVTHFGQVRDVQRRGEELHRLVDAHAALALACRDAGAERARRLREGVRALLLEEARRQAWPVPDEEVLALFELDIMLNADGLAAWLDASGKG
ncbi:MAG: MBL fold metallo-hydrolase [Burkholderiales bacterium]|nr:MBL fold metallo-hydrolase [Burkholderiales bacterium]OJX00146.1 MAG: MBL fold metallo-hydrolase [Burkholderiales bacterium 70-64]